MIYVTGDKHIPIDIDALMKRNFPDQSEMSKNDYVIICGDFGGLWSGGKKEEYWLALLDNRNFITLFVDGNHENFSMLNAYPICQWNGGKIHKIKDSVFHLMRGQIFTIDNCSFFTMGGGTSVDKIFRREGVSWWKEEQPSDSEYVEAITNLDKYNWKEDYVITHTCSRTIMKKYLYDKENSNLNGFFDVLEYKLKFKHWYFGHFHENIKLDNLHTLLYKKMIPVK